MKRPACSRCRQPFHNRRTCDIALWNRPEPPAVAVPLIPAERLDIVAIEDAIGRMESMGKALDTAVRAR